MFNILDTVKGQLGDQAMDMFAKQLGVDTAQADSLVDTLTPLLTGALAKNSTSTEGAESLLAAIEKDHDGSELDQTEDIVNQGGTADASKLLGHIFGDKKEAIEQGAAVATGQGKDTIDKAFSILGPLVMGSLGKAKKEQGLGVSDLVGLLQGNKANASSDSLSGKLVTMLLDKDGDGDIKDDLLNMGMDKLKGFLK